MSKNRTIGFLHRAFVQLRRDTMSIPKAPMRQVIFNIFRSGPVWITVMALLVGMILAPSRTTPERYWIVYIGLAVVAIGIVWHLALIITTPPRWPMVLYMIVNLPILYFMVMIYAEVIAMGHRYWEAPM